MGKFHQFLTELSALNMSVFSFPDDNFSKCQWIFIKLGVCIGIGKTCFRIADGQICRSFTELSTCSMSLSPFLDDNFSKYQWIFTKLGMCIDIVEICFEIASGQISSIFDRVSGPQYIHILLSGQ